jgi:hypothetical protein
MAMNMSLATTRSLDASRARIGDRNRNELFIPEDLVDGIAISAEFSTEVINWILSDLGWGWCFGWSWSQDDW